MRQPWQRDGQLDAVALHDVDDPLRVGWGQCKDLLRVDVLAGLRGRRR